MVGPFTGGDNFNKACFGRKTKFFRESGDFAGNRETIFPGNITYFRTFSGSLTFLRECHQKNREDISIFREDLSYTQCCSNNVC